jgi:hypothetical protein
MLLFASNGVLVNSVPHFLIHTQCVALRRVITDYMALLQVEVGQPCFAVLYTL